MIEQKISKSTLESANILERIAQNIIIAYAWVSGPPMSQQDRINQELAKAHLLEIELENTSIIR